ncbi:MAG: S-layer homology domain-containing protein [Acidimicrobiaceae bacterium]|nr:S-layer homology domain-containing protein [Acidimicrobiaceae bacterium]
MSALVASLFAVGAAPAAALDDDSKPNAAAATSACVGDANSDMMFSDVSEMNALRAEINCLAYYGVTIGYGDGNFGPNDDVTRAQMVLFMERAAAVAGADAEAVVGDFAETGSDPVTRADMALLIARLLVAATNDESPINVTNDDDGTFEVSTVTDAKEWDYFADARRSLNRVSDSAVSALYELGVAKGTGMGYFSPAASVSRAEMAAFITRALGHTSARPAGVTIQSDGPGEVIISVRDANFHPVANAPVDVFSARADQVDEAFDMGSCYMPRLAAVGGNAKLCEIDALDAITGLDGNYDPGAITVDVQAGGTTVWAWTGESGDKVADGGAGLASINLTETSPVTADSAKVTTDMAMGVTRASFGSTVTVTIQLVGANDADAVPDDGGNSYTVVVQRNTDRNIETDATPTAADATQSVVTHVLKADASGKATFEITADDPDPTDSNNADGTSGESDTFKIDRVRVTYTVSTTSGGRDVDNAISSTDGDPSAQTITFSDARGVVTGASLKPAASFLTAPTSGSASNVVTVTVVDQYGKPVRGHLVRLSSNHSSTPDSPPADADLSKFPVARRTDSSGTVRIGYSHSGTGSIEQLAANTSVTAEDGTETLTGIAGGTANFYWARPASTAADLTTLATAAAVRVFDADSNTLVIGGSTTEGEAPLIVRYDGNDQFSVATLAGTAAGTSPLTDMAGFEAQLAKDEDNNDTVAVTSFDPTDSSDVASFVLTEVADT